MFSLFCGLPMCVRLNRNQFQKCDIYLFIASISAYNQLSFQFLQMISDFAAQKTILHQYLHSPSNKLCADCPSISPTWASLDFGVWLCSNCAGAHRALGPTVTRVKSATLDLWQTEWVSRMTIGNQIINKYWESDKGKAVAKKPHCGESLSSYNKYVEDKYIRRKYILPQLNGQPHPLQSHLQNKEPSTQKKQAPFSKPQQILPKLPKIQDKPQTTVRVQPANDINLLDDVFQEQQKVSSLKEQADIQDKEEEFTEYVQAPSNPVSTGLITFDNLLSQTKQNQPQPPAQPIYQNFHHPYHPSLSSNLVYNAYFQQPHVIPQQHFYNHNSQGGMTAFFGGMGL